MQLVGVQQFLKLVPGFFALGILGIGIAVTYGSLRDAGVV